ncbi:activating signal cointegrator 1 complex subunit 2 homolog [Pseudophryne corroboree]|uniref:activating signal cointegrator 1 complex subunit 2 homolog n=1 Tax=Pseudophryne corroboree TaxID=495146 RepID=UPI0030818190
MPHKRRRSEPSQTVTAYQQQQGLSLVAPQPPEELLATPPRPRPHSHHVAVTQRKSATMAATSRPQAADTGEAGPATLHATPQTQSTHVSLQGKSMPHKRRRSEPSQTVTAYQQQQRFSLVAPQPPEELLATPPRPQPHSHHVAESDMPQETQQDTLSDDNSVHQQQPSSPTRPRSPTMRSSLTQTPPIAQLTTQTPQVEIRETNFLTRWSHEQTIVGDYIKRQTQFQASLPHHLPRIS